MRDALHRAAAFLNGFLRSLKVEQAKMGQARGHDEIGRLALQQSLGIGMIANAQGRKATDSAPPSLGENSAGPTIQTS